MNPKILEIRKNILENNDLQAAKLRKTFEENNTLVINVVSSPGSGKTELLTKLMSLMIKDGLKVCAIVGDLETANDAERLKKSGAEAVQINTHGNCHLEANMIEKILEKLNWKDADFMFIENVGNLVCPASYDLGENLRIVILAVTEGEDKPLKYPTIFNSSDMCVITKTDLAEAVAFNKELAIKNIKNSNPDITVIETSAKTEKGVDVLLNNLKAMVEHNKKNNKYSK